MGARPGRAVLRPVRRTSTPASAAAALLGLGAVLMMFGFAFLAPLLVRPLARVLGRAVGALAGPDRHAGARERDPPAAAHGGHRRGADDRPRARRARRGVRRGPAAARSTRRSTTRCGPALIVQNQDGFSPIPAAVRRGRGQGPGRGRRLADAASRSASPRATTRNTAVTGLDPATVNSVLELKWADGDADTLSVADRRPDRRRRRLGRRRTTWPSAARVTFTTPLGKQAELRAGGHVREPGGPDGGRDRSPSTTLERQLEREEHRVRDGGARRRRRPGAARGAGEHGARAVPVRRRAARSISSRTSRPRPINGLLGLVYRPAAAVGHRGAARHREHARAVDHERTRELGMLRAVGMSRRQVWQMVTAESVITAGIGAILGIVLGLVFSADRLAAAGRAGLRVRRCPYVWLILFFVWRRSRASSPPCRRPGGRRRSTCCGR